jgi:hypothetical protein
MESSAITDMPVPFRPEINFGPFIDTYSQGYSLAIVRVSEEWTSHRAWGEDRRLLGTMPH